MIVPLMVLLAQGPDADPRRLFAAGDKDAYLMMPPETACGAQVSEMLWTADGKTLVVSRLATDATPAEAAALALRSPSALPPRLKAQIVVWSAAKRAARAVYSIPGDAGGIGPIQAMPGTDRLVFDASEVVKGANGEPDRATQSVLMLSIGTGAVVRLAGRTETLGPDGRDGPPYFESALLSPGRPLGGLVRYEGRKASVRFFGPDGRLGPSAELPGRTPLRFDAQGYPGWVGSTGPGGKGPVGFHRLDPATGRQVSEKPFPPRAKGEGEPAGPLRTFPFEATVGRSPKAPSILLMVKGGKSDEAGVVSTDGTRPLLSPTNDAVAYVDQGSAMVRLLAKVPREAYDRALADAAKREAVVKAKQVGLGLLMYAGDHGDVLPGADADLRQAIGPYLKNNGPLEGFTYVFNGGSLGAIENVAETQIGYIAGPGGRAALYADGHVKWIADK